MQHHFNINVAKEYGIATAVILDNMSFWIEQNRANRRHFHDGKYWTYNSNRAMTELFPYLSGEQIRYALNKMLKNGLIETGNYNKNQQDRTLWYTITSKGYSICENSQMQVGKFPDHYQIENTDNNISNNIKTDKESRLQAQARFFELYPQVIVDNYDAARLSSLTAEDWEKIIEQFNGSAWLRDKVRTLSKLCKMATRIIAGEFAPFDSASEEERKRREKEFDDL